MTTWKILLLAALAIGLVAFIVKTVFQKAGKPDFSFNEELITPTHYEWSKNATIYEVNIRQHTPEGTFNALAADLPRLQEMGVDVLWLMPIHPISVKNRKGTLGSYYAVSDYLGVNPEYGTMGDFQNLVRKIHELGMKVLIDWVPNHTGWDHVWITEHPEFFTKNKKGEITDPINPETGETWGWTDVADLNYDVKEMREAMTEAMKFWIVEVGIDGFRCDVAHQVPDNFWQRAIQELRRIKPDVFMLAEGEVPTQRNECGFDMDYAWNFKNYTNQIAKGEKKANSLDEYLANDRKTFNKGYHMYFTTNHDENAWEGTVFERLGDGHLAFAVLAFTFDGMPLIYSGQEAGLNKRLEFFEKDTIEWGTYQFQDFYTKLLKFKKENPALWNGTFGAEPVKVPTADADEQAYCYLREKDGNKVFVVLNLSAQPVETSLPGNAYAGTYTELFTDQTTTLEADERLALKPWEYRVYFIK